VQFFINSLLLALNLYSMLFKTFLLYRRLSRRDRRDSTSVYVKQDFADRRTLPKTLLITRKFTLRQKLGYSRHCEFHLRTYNNSQNNAYFEMKWLVLLFRHQMPVLRIRTIFDRIRLSKTSRSGS
jgi:hypothetical protein